MQPLLTRRKPTAQVQRPLLQVGDDRRQTAFPIPAQSVSVEQIISNWAKADPVKHKTATSNQFHRGSIFRKLVVIKSVGKKI